MDTTTIVVLALVIGLPLPFAIRHLAFGKEGMEIRKQLGLKGFYMYPLLMLLSVGFGVGLGIVIKEGFQAYGSSFIIISPLGLGLFILYGRVWTNNQLVKREEEAAQYRKEQEEKRRKEAVFAQQRQQEKEAKRKEAQMVWERTKEPVKSFVKEAANCSSFTDMMKLWDAISKEDCQENREIRRKMEEKAGRERYYGSNPRSIAPFLEDMLLQYGTKDEAIPEAKRPEVGKAQLPESFAVFMDQAAQCTTFAELLAFWDNCCPEQTEATLRIREEICKRYSVERMYGSIPGRVEKFLHSLEREN